MKNLKILVLSLIVFGVSPIYAQEEVYYYQNQNEINVQIDDIFAKNDVFSYLYYGDSYDYIGFSALSMKTPAVGIGYKHYFTNAAMRFKLSNSSVANSYSTGSSDNLDSKYAFFKRSISGGYEIHKRLNRSMVFFGADVVIAFQGISSTEKISNYDGSYEDLESKFRGTSYGIRPFLGFKFYISPQFSVSSEYHFLFERYINRNISDVEREDQTTSENIGFKTSFGPLGQITFSFHF